MLDKLIRFCLENKLVMVLIVLFLTIWGIIVAPFDWEINWLPRNPVPVDAIPDIGENQQIVFTEWMGRSPQDVEDQITYPLTVSLLGTPGVKSIRSYSFFGFSSIYIIFNAMCPHGIGIDVNLVLLHKAPNRGNFAHTVRGKEGVTNRPILNRSKFVKIPTPCGIPLRIKTF